MPAVFKTFFKIFLKMLHANINVTNVHFKSISYSMHFNTNLSGCALPLYSTYFVFMTSFSISVSVYQFSKTEYIRARHLRKFSSQLQRL